jgi:hypothetical protein
MADRSPSLLKHAYRLVVRANEATHRKAFIWQIVRGTAQSREVIAVADRSFSTMEDAHAQGSIALRRYQNQT